MANNTNGGKGSIILGVLWAEAALATLLTIARLCSRHLVEAKYGWDDFFMVLAIVLDVTSHGILTVAVHYGFGSHQYLLSEHNATLALMWSWIFQPLKVISDCCARISITIFLIRLFERKYALKWTVIILAAVNTIFGIVFSMFIFGVCTPTAKLWDHSITTGSCRSPHIQSNLAITKATWAGFADVITAVWPIAIIYHLKMKSREKAFLGLIFALSLAATVCCIMEDVFLGENAIRDDETYQSTNLTIWVGTAANVLIIVGNIPATTPLLKRFFSKTPTQVELSDKRQRRGYYPSKKARKLRDMNTDLTFNSTIVGTDGRGVSEEHMLGDLESRNDFDKNGIQIRTDVTVDFQSK